MGDSDYENRHLDTVDWGCEPGLGVGAAGPGLPHEIIEFRHCRVPPASVMRAVLAARPISAAPRAPSPVLAWTTTARCVGRLTGSVGCLRWPEAVLRRPVVRRTARSRDTALPQDPCVVRPFAVGPSRRLGASRRLLGGRGGRRPSFSGVPEQRRARVGPVAGAMAGVCGRAGARVAWGARRNGEGGENAQRAWTKAWYCIYYRGSKRTVCNTKRTRARTTA